MTIDIHADYMPQNLIAIAREHGANMGVRVVDTAGSAPSFEFSYGFKKWRPFFPKLIESAAQRIASLNSERIDRQLVATWPDIYGYGLPREECAAWHILLNDTLAGWCGENAGRMSFVASVPLPNAEDAAIEIDRAEETAQWPSWCRLMSKTGILGSYRLISSGQRQSNCECR